MHTPGSPVTLAQPSAACVPPSSWRTATWRIWCERLSASYSGRIAAPGTPNATRTPSSSSTSTTASIGLIQRAHDSASAPTGIPTRWSGELLDHAQQRGVILAAMARSARRLCEHLVDQPRSPAARPRRPWPARSAIPRSLWCRSTRKPGVKSCSRKLRRRTSITLLAARPPTARRDHHLGINAGLGAQHERLTDRLDHERDHDLVTGLDDLAGAGLADVTIVLPSTSKIGRARSNAALLPADHDRQRAVAGADVATADRGVKHLAPRVPARARRAAGWPKERWCSCRSADRQTRSPAGRPRSPRSRAGNPAAS